MKPDHLRNIALKHHCDKAGHHEYCGHYQKHFERFADKPIKLLELGIGGYDFKDRGGAGLKTWSEFFSKGQIYGLDIHDKSGIQLPARTKIFKGSQADGDFLLKMMSEIGNPEIIIDDASHMNVLTIMSFKHLFPWVKPGGIYVIEDIESSWWTEHGFDGVSDPWDYNTPTSVNLARDLVTNVNAPRYVHADWAALPIEQYPIASIHFYPNLVIFEKK